MSSEIPYEQITSSWQKNGSVARRTLAKNLRRNGDGWRFLQINRSCEIGDRGGNKVETEAELHALRTSVKRGLPFGDDRWTKSSAVRLALESTTRPRGRPKKET